MSNSPSNGGNVYVAYQANSYLFGGNAPYVEEMYENYLNNPGSVPDNWRSYFDALQHVPAVDGTDAREAAKAWLAANPGTWEPWLDGVTTKDGGDAKAAVTAALQ